MKVKLFILTFLTMILFSGQSQVFQKHFQIPGYYFHEVCTEQFSAATNDQIVGGNYFDNNFLNPMMELIRIDVNYGYLTWQHTYIDPTGVLEEVRLFDMVAYTSNGEDMLAITGSVTSLGMKYIFIATVDEFGNFVSGSFYTDIPTAGIHSQGLSIIYTQQDQEGFVVGGFKNMDYNHGTPDIKSGFVMQVDMNLNPIWVVGISYNQTISQEYYEMVSDVTEVLDGFFITGSVTYMHPYQYTQQAVLCMKIDLNGNLQWENSYLIGNSRDVGVDAYYDEPTDEIYLLTNYSYSHYFGITVFDNATGDIDLSRSWLALGWNNLNRYGFNIMESCSDNISNLVIAGYMREEQYDDPYGNPVLSQTIPFVYEFEKASGEQVGSSFFYNIPFMDPGFSDYFDFWNNGQSPLIYHPHMALKLNNGTGYFIAGFRSNSSNAYTDIELFTTDFYHLNECDQTPIMPLHEPIQPTPVATYSSNTALPGPIPFTLTKGTYDDVLYVASCDSIVGIIQHDESDIEIYPNPASDQLHVKITDQYAISQYAIFNTLGSKVAEGKINTETSVINISTLNKGVYFIRIYYNDQYIVKKVFIHQ